MKRVKDILAFIVLVILGRLWIAFDQDLLPQHLLMPAFIVVFLVLLTAYFFVVRPNNAQRFAFILSLILLPIVVFLTLLQHVMINHDFTEVWRHSLVIWGISFAMPYAAGFTYGFMRRKSPPQN